MAENLVVGVARLVMRLPGCRSLKEKRAVIRSVRDRLKARHNVSVAEVGAQDEHGRIVIGLAMVGSDAPYVEGALQTLMDNVEGMGKAPVVERGLKVESWGDSLALPWQDDPPRW